MTDTLTLDRSDAADAARYRYLVKNADRGGHHLLRLLSAGKGTEDDFHQMLDRIMASKRAAALKAQEGQSDG